MSLFVVHPMPLLMARRGFLWDGIPANYTTDCFGPGTPNPFGLTRSRINHWYWNLDQWQMQAAFDARIFRDGVLIDTSSQFIDFDEYPDGGEGNIAVPTRKRVIAYGAGSSAIKFLPGFFQPEIGVDVGGTIDWGLGVGRARRPTNNILFDPATDLYYPVFVLTATASRTTIDAFVTEAQQESTAMVSSLSGLDTHGFRLPTGVSIDIDDQTGDVVSVPLNENNLDLYPHDADGPPFYDSVQNIHITALTIKPTAYLTS